MQVRRTTALFVGLACSIDYITSDGTVNSTMAWWQYSVVRSVPRQLMARDFETGAIWQLGGFAVSTNRVADYEAKHEMPSICHRHYHGQIHFISRVLSSPFGPTS